MPILRALLIVLACVGTAVAGGKLSSFDQHELREFDSLFRRYDGELRATEPIKLMSHIRDYEGAVEQFEKQLAKIKDQSHPDVQARRKQIDDYKQLLAEKKAQGEQDKAAAGEAAKAAADQAKADKAAAAARGDSKESFYAFVHDVAKPLTYEHVRALLWALRYPADKITFVNEKDMKLALDELATIDQLCKTRYQGIKNYSPPSKDLRDDAVAWCEAADRRVELAKQTLAWSVDAIVKVQLDQYRSMMGDAQEGFVTRDQAMLWHPADAVSRHLAPLVAAVGATMPDVSGVKAQVEAARTKLLDTVKAAMAHTKMPAGKGHHSSEALAKKQIEIPGAKVMTSAMTDTTWTVTTDEVTREPKWREREGYVVYKVPSEPWCRVDAFAYDENYAGGGKYEPQSEVRFPAGSSLAIKCK